MNQETNRERIVRLEAERIADREAATRTASEVAHRFSQQNQWRETLNDVVNNKVNRIEFDRRTDSVDTQLSALTLTIAEGRAADEARRRVTAATLVVVGIVAPIVTAILILLLSQ